MPPDFKISIDDVRVRELTGLQLIACNKRAKFGRVPFVVISFFLTILFEIQVPHPLLQTLKSSLFVCIVSESAKSSSISLLSSLLSTFRLTIHSQCFVWFLFHERSNSDAALRLWKERSSSLLSFHISSLHPSSHSILHSLSAVPLTIALQLSRPIQHSDTTRCVIFLPFYLFLSSLRFSLSLSRCYNCPSAWLQTFQSHINSGLHNMREVKISFPEGYSKTARHQDLKTYKIVRG